MLYISLLIIILLSLFHPIQIIQINNHLVHPAFSSTPYSQPLISQSIETSNLSSPPAVSFSPYYPAPHHDNGIHPLRLSHPCILEPPPVIAYEDDLD